MRHVLHAAGDDDLGVAEPDGTGAEHDGLEAGAADLVDGQRRDRVGKTGVAHRLAGGGLAGPACQHLADDHLVDRLRRQPGALQKSLDDGRRQRGASTSDNTPPKDPIGVRNDSTT